MFSTDVQTAVSHEEHWEFKSQLSSPCPTPQCHCSSAFVLFVFMCPTMAGAKGMHRLCLQQEIIQEHPRSINMICTVELDGLQGRDWLSKVPPTVGDQVSGDLRILSMHKSVRSDKRHPKILGELADAVAKPLSDI